MLYRIQDAYDPPLDAVQAAIVAEHRDRQEKPMGIKNRPLRSEYWRKKAEKARATADQMDDEVAKGMALKIADMYDELAARAAKRERRTEEPVQDST